MNKIIIFISLFVSIFLINFGSSTKAQIDDEKIEIAQIQANNFDMKQKIISKKLLPKQVPVPLSMEYSTVLNQIRLLEIYSGIRMDVQLEGVPDSQDISGHYENTQYKGIRGLKIKIVIDRFSKDTDMGGVLYDIHLLEKNTDFVISEIDKENNNLIAKGEVYGL